MRSQGPRGRRDARARRVRGEKLPPAEIDEGPEKLLLPTGEFGRQPSWHNRVGLDEVFRERTGMKYSPFVVLS